MGLRDLQGWTGRALAGAAVALSVTGVGVAQPGKTERLTVDLVGQTQGVAPGQTVYVGLHQQIRPGWHTYWRNPGDSGQATKAAWRLPPGWSAGPFVWPVPVRIPVGPLMNYGYAGEVILPVAITASADSRPGTVAKLAADVSLLVCADICVPETATVALDLPVTAGGAPADPKWGAAIKEVLDAEPSRGALSAVFRRQGDALKLAVTGANLRSVDATGAYFFPDSAGVIDHAKPQAIERGPEGLTLTLAPRRDTASGGSGALTGVLVAGGQAYEVAARAGPLPDGAAGLGAAGGGARTRAALQLAGGAFSAFIGGLILNLMPCVFPVLAMKTAQLSRHAHDRANARREGLAFGVGVLGTFLGLAAALIALKAAGSAVGWGFQLQSPMVVAFLALLMLGVALNLSGLFEVGASIQGAGGGLVARDGLAGAFFTGALSVVVAAPCTAPFMGPAIGWALTQPPGRALSVFMALGLGFALPFVAVAFAPGLLARLPKPGPWMETFRKALAFPMYGAAAWLVWVVAQQTEAGFLASVLAAGVALAAAAWLVGIAQRAHAAGGRPVGLVGGAGLLAVLAVVAIIRPAEHAAVTAEPYSLQRLAELRAEGRPVFVNYTAAWCVSCQVNDRVAISTEGAARAFHRSGAAYLKADWTRRDPAIAADLEKFGRAGVPLYLVYGLRTEAPVVLPAILTEGAVVRALDEAGREAVASRQVKAPAA